jgi:hypothetical protein
VLGAFSDQRDWPQLIHIATDGESYGHHHRHGDMALASALHYIESNQLARLTNYGEYLEKHPPTQEVVIAENTAWSCAHGIERWRSNCGCNSGGNPRWDQEWRAPLRAALDWLRDTMATAYRELASTLLDDPWAARNDYIDVVLDRSPGGLDDFLSRHATRDLSHEEKITAIKLLEMQRQAMLMYTSCGWFFDELSGTETVQVIQYAARAVQLAQESSGDSFEPQFLELLAQARSNIPAFRDGRWIYENLVRGAIVDLTKVAAHYAVSSLFEEYGEESQIYGYTVQLEDHQVFEAGRAKLAIGRARVTHQIVQEGSTMAFVVLHLGDHNLNADVREYRGEEAYQATVQGLSETFGRGEFTEVIRMMDQQFGANSYSLRSLFKDEQRKVLEQVLESTLAGVEAVYRQQYENNYPLVRFLIDLGNPIPKALHAAVEFVVNTDLRNSLSQDELDSDRIDSLLEDARAGHLDLDGEGLGLLLQQNVESIMERFSGAPNEDHVLGRLVQAARLSHSMPFEVDLWRVQNLYYELLHGVYPLYRDQAGRGDTGAREWVSQFTALGQQLSVKVG